MKKSKTASSLKSLLVLGFTVLTLGTAFAAHVPSFLEQDKPDTSPGLVYQVDEGDTVWGIARQFCPDNQDIRYMVHRIYRDNNLKENADLRPGQDLVIHFE
ncbi:LysM peptidoglycan-binding domain-containing protein [Megasphaera elsdenii]